METQNTCTDPGEVADSEQSTDNVTVHGAGHALHLDRAVAQHALLWPVLRTTLSTDSHSVNGVLVRQF